jgi:pilus assembly protein TadC
MSRRNVAIFAVFMGSLYAAGMIGRGEVVPGLVGGVLCAVLAFLVFTEVGKRQRRRMAERERRESS